jgi:hypothetical protein
MSISSRYVPLYHWGHFDLFSHRLFRILRVSVARRAPPTYSSLFVFILLVDTDRSPLPGTMRDLVSTNDQILQSMSMPGSYVRPAFTGSSYCGVFGSVSGAPDTNNESDFLPFGRRRSHRPRGCRGGRKNRKTQLAKATSLLPKEIFDPVPLAPKSLVDPVGTADRSRTWPFGSRTRVGVAFWEPTFAPGVQLYKPVLNLKHNFCPVQENRPDPRFGDPSEGNRSTAAPTVYTTQAIPSTSSRVFQPHHQVSCEILPPPPLTCTNYSPSPVQIHEGPNPYALSSNESIDIYSNDSGDEGGNDILLMGVTATETKDSYRNQHMEKHCNTVTNGGSLFVTSPRSFLLGHLSNNKAW